MKTKTVSAIRTYAVQQFCYDKIGLEDTFPSSVPDIDCIKQLHERIDAMAREVYPWYFEQKGLSVLEVFKAAGNSVPETNGSIDYNSGGRWHDSKPTNEEEQSQKPLIQAIQAVKNTEELELYFKVIDKKPEGDEKKELWKIYDEQYDKLQNQPA